MITVCSNGDRLRGSHPVVPITPDGLAADAAEGVRAVEVLASSGFRDSLVRVLVEVDDADPDVAVAHCWEIEAALDEAGIAAPRLHHGEDLATWAVIDAALERGRDVRIGLEDTLVMADGSPAPSNAALVAEVARRAGAS